MSKKTSLERYALFYEKLEASKPSNSPEEQGSRDTNYDKAPSLTEDQIRALQEDLQRPVNRSEQQQQTQA